jgi:hypothetical protein
MEGWSGGVMEALDLPIVLVVVVVLVRFPWTWTNPSAYCTRKYLRIGYDGASPYRYAVTPMRFLSYRLDSISVSSTSSRTARIGKAGTAFGSFSLAWTESWRMESPSGKFIRLTSR